MVAHNGTQLWEGARDTIDAASGSPSAVSGKQEWDDAWQALARGCGEVSMRTDDPSIDPPVSSAEAAYQCSPGAPPCKLHWNPGMLCYTVNNASWPTGGGATLPGYKERATMLGYRTVAAPSGTTANMLQLGQLLGFGTDELVLLRAVMAAWMLPTDDHSFLEIMLGAETFMPREFGITLGRKDLGQLWPPGYDLQTHGGKFRAADTWRAFGRRLDTPMGKALLAQMTEGAREYVLKLARLDL